MAKIKKGDLVQVITGKKQDKGERKVAFGGEQVAGDESPAGDEEEDDEDDVVAASASSWMCLRTCSLCASHRDWA